MKNGRRPLESDSRSKNRCCKQWVAEQIKGRYGHGENAWRIWNPVPNTSSDLLVTSADCRKAVLLHITYSKTHPKDYPCTTSGWHDVDRADLEKTKADFWVFVTKPIQKGGKTTASDCDFIIIRPMDLLERLAKTCPDRQPFRLYLTHIGETVIDTRNIDALGDGQAKGDVPLGIQKAIQDTTSLRNYTQHLGNWALLEGALGHQRAPRKG